MIRPKGIVHFAGQRTPDHEAWDDERPQTQLVFIGEDGICTDDLRARFDACRTE